MGIVVLAGLAALLKGRRKTSKARKVTETEKSEEPARINVNDGHTGRTVETQESTASTEVRDEPMTHTTLPESSEQLPDIPKSNVQPSRRIGQYDDEMNLIAEYESAGTAAKALGSNRTSIRNAAEGKQKHAAGYVWKYLD